MAYNSAYARAYYLANKERVTVRMRLRYQENRELLLAQGKAYRLANPERVATQRRASHLKSHFGMSIDEYEAMVKDQDGVCAICRKPDRYGLRLAVDHSHSNGVIRGLLCKSCNQAIGMFHDRPDILERALEYLT